ncbi:MAG: hypothetical protein CL609_24930 [Anaerolineaceae bacterium]|nr:hypothetical protein [Anaerolineaceae bacterium]
MAVIIREVTTKKQLRTFIDFSLKLYDKNPYWVPPLYFDELNTLDWDKNPAFEDAQARYWLAYRGNQVVGRIAGIYNPKYVQKWGKKNVRFGWIDFINDEEVSAALLKTVEDWARTLNMEAVHGPLGFTDLDPEGMLIEGFEELGTLALIYNYEYYPEHLKKLGYEKEIDWLEYEIHVPEKPIEKISKAAEIVLKRNNLHILEVNHKKDLLRYSKELFYLLDDEYSHLFGTVPLSEKQMETYINQYFGFISPEFVPVVLDENNKMIAFGIVMPSLSIALQKSKGKLFPLGWYYLLRALKKNDRADLYLIAVKSEYQGKGINAVLMDKINQVFINKGITIVETNAELETNTDVQGQWKYYEKRQHKRRRCFIKTL